MAGLLDQAKVPVLGCIRNATDDERVNKVGLSVFGFFGFAIAVALFAIPHFQQGRHALTPGSVQRTMTLEGSVLAAVRSGIAYELVVQVTARGMGATGKFQASDLTVTSPDGTPLRGVRSEPIALEDGQTQVVRLQYRGPVCDVLNVRFNVASQDGVGRVLNERMLSYVVPVTLYRAS